MTLKQLQEALGKEDKTVKDKTSVEGATKRWYCYDSCCFGVNKKGDVISLGVNFDVIPLGVTFHGF